MTIILPFVWASWWGKDARLSDNMWDELPSDDMWERE